MEMQVSQFAGKEQDEARLLDQNRKWTGGEYAKLISKCQMQSPLRRSRHVFPRYRISSEVTWPCFEPSAC